MILTLFGSLKEAEEPKKRGIFERMREAVTRTRENLSQSLEEIVALTVEIDDKALDELEMSLIAADLGVVTAQEILSALRERALALGWSLDRIVVIDSDLGQSGASAADREGFQRLVTEVSLGRVGIVLGLVQRDDAEDHAQRGDAEDPQDQRGDREAVGGPRRRIRRGLLSVLTVWLRVGLVGRRLPRRIRHG